MTEMEKLEKMLNVAGIPYEVAYPFDKPQIIYPSKENRVCDAICHRGSYGYEDGLLEIMGLVDEEAGDEVEGYLTADDVFRRIVDHYIPTLEEFRKSTEQMFIDAVRTMWKAYTKYNPNGKYLSIAVVDGNVSVHNAHFEDCSDKFHIIDRFDYLDPDAVADDE